MNEAAVAKHLKEMDEEAAKLAAVILAGPGKVPSYDKYVDLVSRRNGIVFSAENLRMNLRGGRDDGGGE